jgi:hypothetical protein
LPRGIILISSDSGVAAGEIYIWSEAPARDWQDYERFNRDSPDDWLLMVDPAPLRCIRQASENLKQP